MQGDDIRQSNWTTLLQFGSLLTVRMSESLNLISDNEAMIIAGFSMHTILLCPRWSLCSGFYPSTQGENGQRSTYVCT